MKLLTPRQQEILNLIRSHIQDTGFPPTRLEICQALGFKSPNAAEEHLKALVKKGAIRMTAGASRGIQLIEPDAGTPKSAKSPAGQRLLNTMARLGESLQTISLPLVGRVAAGSPILAQQHIEEHFQVDPALFKTQPDYLLKVRGLSMRDAGLLDGDLLAVKKLANPSEVRNGQVVVARLEDEVTVKRFERQGHTVLLHPENPDYPVIRVDTRQEPLTIEGLAVGMIRQS
ncbi:MAG: transcriptional repressor LexA [Burkholderiaceae bacterium]